MNNFLAKVRKDPTNPVLAVTGNLEDLSVSHPIPKPSVTQARRAAGDLVACGIGGEVLTRYTYYACS